MAQQSHESELPDDVIQNSHQENTQSQAETQDDITVTNDNIANGTNDDQQKDEATATDEVQLPQGKQISTNTISLQI